MAEESNFLHKESCPECGSKDNLARYDDGHAHCFSVGCDYFEPADGQEKSIKKENTPKEFTPMTGEFRALDKRGIREETCRKYGYKVGYMSGGEICQFVDVKNPDGVLVAQKIRTRDKDFRVKGKLTGELIGSHLFSGGRKMVITEGEIDMLSLSQAQGNRYAVTSLPNGISSVKKTITNNIEYLDNFDEILICFDMDEPGRKGAIEAAELLVDHKSVKIMSLPLKDANECLVAGRTEELINAIWTAKEHRPDGLLTAEELIDEALKPLPKGLPWIYEGLNNSSNGRHYGEIILVGAGTGVGKTDFMLAQADYDIRVLHQKVGLFMLESDPTEVLQYLGGKADGRLYYEPGHPDQLDREAQKKAYSKYKDRLYIYDSFGLCDWSKVKTKILYLINRSYKVFVLDHLTALATGGSKNEKEELEDIMADIAAFAKRHNVVFHLVSHLTTPDKGSHEEGSRVSVRNLKGSRATGFWAHQVLGLERNQQAEDPEERNITTVRQLKRRKYGKGVGKCTYLKYDGDTGLSLEVPAKADPQFKSDSEEF